MEAVRGWVWIFSGIAHLHITVRPGPVKGNIINFGERKSRPSFSFKSFL